MTEVKPKARPKAKPKAKPESIPEPVEAAPEPTPVKNGMVKVTPASDLRVVTKDFVVLFLLGGVTRELAENIAFEARRCAAEQSIELTVE